MTTTIATPKFDSMGFKDAEPVNQTYDVPIPAHLPLLFLLTERGTEEVNIIPSNLVANHYGLNSFDEVSPFYTHQTKLASEIINNNSTVAIKRITLPNSSRAIIRLSLEFAPCEIPVYVRDSNGDVVYDMVDDVSRPRTAGTINGTKLIWHTGQTHIEDTPFSERAVIQNFRDGSMMSIRDGVLSSYQTEEGYVYGKSKLYPILDLEIKDIGKFGNNIGIILEKLVKGISLGTDYNLVDRLKSTLYKLRVVEKNDVSYTLIKTTGNDTFARISMHSTDFDYSSNKSYYLPTVVESYNVDREDIRSSAKRPLGRIHVYDKNVTEITNMLYHGYVVDGVNFTGEKDHLEQDGIVKNPQEVDFLTGININGKLHSSFITVGASFGGYEFNDGLPVYATGGSDGLVLNEDYTYDNLANLSTYDQCVRTYIGDVISDNTNLGDIARFPVSAVWDSGFSLETKKALISLMGFRKDIIVFLSTYIQADFITVVDEETVVVRPIISCAGASQDAVIKVSPAGTYSLEMNGRDIADSLSLPMLIAKLRDNNLVAFTYTRPITGDI